MAREYATDNINVMTLLDIPNRLGVWQQNTRKRRDAVVECPHFGGWRVVNPDVFWCELIKLWVKLSPAKCASRCKAEHSRNLVEIEGIARDTKRGGWAQLSWSVLCSLLNRYAHIGRKGGLAKPKR